MYKHTNESRALLDQLPAESQALINESPELADWFIALVGGDTQGGYAVAYVESLGYEVSK